MFFNSIKNLLILNKFRYLGLNQYYCTVKKKPVIVNRDFYEKILDITPNESTKLYRDCKFKGIKCNDIVEVIDLLKRNYNYKLRDIYENRGILLVGPYTIENRYRILVECLFKNIELHTLFKYVICMNKPIKLLKVHNLIDANSNVGQNLIDQFKEYELKLELKYNEEIDLALLRKYVLNSFLKMKFNLTDEELVKIWKTYPRMKHKSFQSIQHIIDILQNQLNFTNERIIKNGFLLHAEPNNVLKIMKFLPILCGHDVKEILWRRPKIMMTTYESLCKILDVIHEHDIPDSYVSRCLEIFTLGAETISERLKDIKSIEEFDVLSNNPRILRLIHYQNKARTRLDYLKQIKVKCASLHILSSHSEAFEKYARDGTDRTKGHDISFYVASEINILEEEIRNILSRHPNWCHVPLLSVKDSLDFLKDQGFASEDIFSNLHLVLYPLVRIKEKLVIIYDRNGELKDTVEIDNLTKSHVLGLCLYLIEKDFHFTGDGIWIDPTPQQQVDHFITLPEMPVTLVKKYKYGSKLHSMKNETSRSN